MRRLLCLLCVFSILALSGCSMNRSNETLQTQDAGSAAATGDKLHDSQFVRRQYTDEELDEIQAAFQRSQYSREENEYSVQSAEFDAIAVGDSLQDVIAVDPNGSYLFLQTGRNDQPHTSTHYTPDGQEIVITYDENNHVQEVEKTPFT